MYFMHKLPCIISQNSPFSLKYLFFHQTVKTKIVAYDILYNVAKFEVLVIKIMCFIGVAINSGI